MNIYISSSWRNQHAVELLTDVLRAKGHVVHSFVEKGLTDDERAKVEQFGLTAWIESESGREKFEYDLEGATKSDLVIYLGPSGQDSCAEIGAAWASKVPIFGLWGKGDGIGLMRRMMERWFYSWAELVMAIDRAELVMAIDEITAHAEGPPFA